MQSVTPILTLLRAIERLHSEGFEQVRARLYIYSLGTWRCELEVGESAVWDIDKAFFGYSSANEWKYFGDDDQPTTVDDLASRLRDRIPDPVAASVPSPGYRFWYSALLERCGEDGVPYLFSDYEDGRADGFVRIVDTTRSTAVDRFPLPPAR